MSDDFTERNLGAKRPRSFALDASILDDRETYEAVATDIKQNRIEFLFPIGVNDADLREECRILTQLDDFDAMYDFTMQLLVGKDLVINLTNYDGTKTQLAAFHIVDLYQNLRGVEAINNYPILVTWLTEFIAGMLVKKLPLPGTAQNPPSEAAPVKEENKTRETPRTKRS